MTTAADRKRRGAAERQRRPCAVAHEHDAAKALIIAERLTEPETLRRSLVEREMAKPHAESSDGETVTTILRQLVAEVRGLRADLARQHTGGDLGGDDVRTANLLSAIAEAVGDRLFTSGELVEHAKVVAGPLRAVLDEINVATPRRLGKCLGRIEGRECAGLAVQRVGTDADGIIWKIVSMSL